MKPRNFLNALILLLSMFALDAIGQSTFGSQIVHHYALDTRDMDEIVLNLPENTYEVKTTSSQRLLINLNITTNSSSEKAVQVLVKQGRYELNTKKDNTTRKMIVESFEERGVIFINGKELMEDVKYTIYIPKHLIYKPTAIQTGDEPIANK